MVRVSRMDPVRKRFTRISPPRSTPTASRVNGASSMTPVIRSGAVAAAMVAAPPLIDWPMITAGPPR